MSSNKTTATTDAGSTDIRSDLKFKGDLSQFDHLSEGDELTVHLEDQAPPDADGSTVWRDRDGGGLDRPYKVTIVGEFAGTSWYGKRPSEIRVQSDGVEYQIEVDKIDRVETEQC